MAIKRLIDEVLEKLSTDELFKKQFEENRNGAIIQALHNLLNDGHEVPLSKNELSAINAIDHNQYHKNVNIDSFGFLFGFDPPKPPKPTDEK